MTSGSQSHFLSQAPDVQRRGYCNLDPLRTDGPDSLRPANIPEIREIRLIELEIVWEGTPFRVQILKGDDLLGDNLNDDPGGIPRTGRITRAVFSVEFSYSPHFATVQISACESPALPGGHDTELLQRWLHQAGFCA